MSNGEKKESQNHILYVKISNIKEWLHARMIITNFKCIKMKSVRINIKNSNEKLM